MMTMRVRGMALAALALLCTAGVPMASARAAETGSTLILPGSGGEILAAALPAGWTRGWSGAEGDTTAVEWRKSGKPGEIIMVTRVGGLASADPAEYVRQSVDLRKSQCDDVVEGQVRTEADGSVRTAIGCTRLKSGDGGDVQLLHIVPGRDALYVARRVWAVPAYDKAKIPLSPQVITTGGAEIDGLTVCNLPAPGIIATPCPPGLAAALKDKITDLSPLVLRGTP